MSTNRKIQTENHVNLSISELMAIYDNAPIMMLLIDQDHRIKNANRAAITFTDRQEKTIEDIRFGMALRCVHALTQSVACGKGSYCKNCMIRNTVLESFKTGREYHRVEAPLHIQSKKRSVELHFLLSTRPLHISNDKYLLAYLEDITGLKQVEGQLRKSEERYFLAQRAANIGSWDWNVLTGDLKWSDRIEPMFGIADGEFESTYQAFLQCVHPDDRNFVEKSVNSSLKDNIPYNIEHRILWPDGSLRWVSETGEVFRDKNGNPVRMVGIVRDITDRKLSQKALAESENKYRTLFETMTQGVVYQNRDGKIISANPAAERILGLTIDQMQGRTSMDPRWKAIHEDGSDFIGTSHPSMLALRTGKEVHDVIMGVFNPIDNGYRWVEIDAVPQFKSGEKKPFQVYTTFNDITVRKNNEDQIKYLNNLLVSIKDIGQIISHESKLKNLFQQASNLLLKTRNYMDITFAMLDTDKQKLRPFAHSGKHNPNIWKIEIGHKEIPDCIQTVLKSRSPLILGGTDSQCTKCHHCSHKNDHQTILIPMVYEDSLIGIMIVCLSAHLAFNTAETSLLAEIGEDLAFAHAKIKADESLRKARDELEIRVHERTAELVKANQALQSEMSERVHYQNKLRSLASELSLAEERERRRIATELHDRIVQTLAVTKIKVSALREETLNTDFFEPIKNILELIDHSIQDTRTITFELSPPILYELGLIPAVEWLAEKFEIQYSIKTNVTYDTIPIPLDADIRIVLFQTTRELLNNIAKHAQAKNVDINFKRHKNYIQIMIQDDGVGFDTSKIYLRMENASGFGLFNIRERLDHLGGSFEIHSKKNHGTQIVLSAPLKEDNHQKD